jgi:hypothetical protein
MHMTIFHFLEDNVRTSIKKIPVVNFLRGKIEMMIKPVGILIQIKIHLFLSLKEI